MNKNDNSQSSLYTHTFANGFIEGFILDTDGLGFNLTIYRNGEDEHYDIRFDVVNGVIIKTHEIIDEGI